MSADDSNSWRSQFRKYGGKGLLVDTNLLILYLVGLATPQRITTFKPIVNQGFSTADFELLRKITLLFKRLVTTPHILTEISNHSDKLKGVDKLRFYALLRSKLVGWKEHYTESAELCQRDEFIKLGLTDTAITDIAPGNFLVITVDFELAGHLQKKKVDVINFNHLRQVSWSLNS